MERAPELPRMVENDAVSSQDFHQFGKSEIVQGSFFRGGHAGIKLRARIHSSGEFHEIPCHAAKCLIVACRYDRMVLRKRRAAERTGYLR